MRNLPRYLERDGELLKEFSCEVATVSALYWGAVAVLSYFCAELCARPRSNPREVGCDVLVAAPKSMEDQQGSGTFAVIRYAKLRNVTVVVMEPCLRWLNPRVPQPDETASKKAIIARDPSDVLTE
jgi:hypothetical protein